jgi:hypothetical protein
MLVNFSAVWSVLQPFVMFCGHSVWLFGIFFLFWYVVPRKIWQPCSHSRSHVGKLGPVGRMQCNLWKRISGAFEFWDRFLPKLVFPLGVKPATVGELWSLGGMLTPHATKSFNLKTFSDWLFFIDLCIDRAKRHSINGFIFTAKVTYSNWQNMGCVLFRAFILPTHYVTLTAAFLFVTLSFPSNLSIKMGGTDRRGILLYVCQEHNNRHRSAVGCTGTTIIS